LSDRDSGKIVTPFFWFVLVAGGSVGWRVFSVSRQSGLMLLWFTFWWQKSEGGSFKDESDLDCISSPRGVGEKSLLKGLVSL